MQDTAIVWTEKTWNPVSGCSIVSSECKHCYAMRIAEPKRGTPAFPNGFDITLRPHKLREPMRMEPSLIFVNSMSDLFHVDVPDDYRDRVIDVIRQTPQHQYQTLTKRPDNAARYWSTRKVPSNLWMGTTIGHQSSMHRLEHLKRIDAEIRFVSAEPLLGVLDFGDLSGIHWVIGGGESGSHLFNGPDAEARAMARYNRTMHKWEPREDRAPWARAIRDQCTAQGVAFFWKQWGGRMGHDAGRILDGRTWDEFPREPPSGWRTDLVRKPQQSLPVIQ